MAKTLPSSLTSYDLLKTAALLLMIVDHIGYYFYPDEWWIRAVGRLSAPIWLFLIGYARSRDLPVKLWSGMIVLVVTNYVVGTAILPVNILGTIILARLTLNSLMSAIKNNKTFLYPIVVTLTLAAPITFFGFDYGTSAMLPVMLGYIVRHREEGAFSKGCDIEFALFSGLAFSVLEAVVFFPFNFPQRIFVGVGIMAVMLALTRFKSFEFPNVSGLAAATLKFCGRNTLEIYVIHLLIFKFTALAIGQKGFDFLNFHIF